MKYQKTGYERGPSGVFSMVRAGLDAPRCFGCCCRRTRNLNKIFCSELVADVLKYVGLLGGSESSNEYTPKDFEESHPDLDAHYESHLSELKYAKEVA